MTDDKLVKDASSEEQERVTMHLLVLRQPAKPAASGALAQSSL